MVFFSRDILEIEDFSKNDLKVIFQLADRFFKQPYPDLLKGKILASCFFEPSSRTRLSFESAMYRLGGSVVGFSEKEQTSLAKGESLHDTVKMVENYADIMVLRHPNEGAAGFSAELIDIPVINAGDGTHQHPTQAFIDLYTIWKTQGRIENLSIGIAGDLRYGRAPHSLALALTLFNPRLYFISPPSFEMSEQICNTLKEKGIKFSFHYSIEEVIPKLDILYMTRFQKERVEGSSHYEFLLRKKDLERAKPNCKILHPLPRVEEIDYRIDKTPYAYYFEQARYGVCIREALLALLLRKEIL